MEFVFSEESGDNVCNLVAVKIYFGSAPVPIPLYMLLKTLSSHPYLQTQLTGKGGQIPGKEQWLN